MQIPKCVLNVVSTRVAVVALACLFAVPVSAKPLEDANWLEVTTPNFQIHSLLSEDKTVELVRHLELLRVAVPRLTKAKVATAAIPTEIYAVRSRSDFRKFGIHRNAAGSFSPGLRTNTILIRNSSSIEESSVIMHEYVHDLLRANEGFYVPRWFSEGISEYYGASIIKGENFEVGRRPKHRIPALERLVSARGQLDWINSNILLDSSASQDLSGRSRAVFYSQSWLLIHYLQHAEKKPVSATDGFRRFAELVNSGADEVQSFAEAFQIEASSLKSELKSYLKHQCCGYFPIRIKQLLPEFSPTIKELTRAEASLNLARLALQQGEQEAAEHWFDIALAADTTQARALSESALLYLLREEFDESERRVLEAIALSPDDPYIQLNSAMHWIVRAGRIANREQRAEFIDIARSSIHEAWKIDQTIPEVYALNGMIYLMHGQDVSKAIEMIAEAARLLPSNPDVRLLLANAYANAGRDEDAIEQAQTVINWSHEQNEKTRQAQALIDRLEGRDAESVDEAVSDNEK